MVNANEMDDEVETINDHQKIKVLEEEFLIFLSSMSVQNGETVDILDMLEIENDILIEAKALEQTSIPVKHLDKDNSSMKIDNQKSPAKENQ